MMIMNNFMPWQTHSMQSAQENMLSSQQSPYFGAMPYQTYLGNLYPLQNTALNHSNNSMFAYQHSLYGSGFAGGMSGLMGYFMLGIMQIMIQLSALMSKTSGCLCGPVDTPPVCEEPPIEEPPAEEPPVYEEPPYYPPQEPKILGSAGVFGDPKFGIFSPEVGPIPQVLKSFESGIQAGQEVTLLNDADQNGFEVKVQGIQVNPEDANSTGIGRLTINAGQNLIQLSNDGKILVNGQLKGNVNDSGLIAPIQLAGGVVISTSLEIDGPNGEKKERFVIQNGEYKLTAAIRSPHPDSANYLDLNFEELLEDAADNATGYKVNVSGLNKQFGIAELLKLEPGDLAIA